ncbi:MAG: ABC transporter substrate-binding protein [Clostridia bacterium]|jgi:peptide/nickel transport system substrate-binding protein
MKRGTALFLTMVFLLTILLSGCGGKPVTEPTQTPQETAAPEETQTPEEAPEETTAPDTVAVTYKESPSLAGKGLPPVEERLPKEPKLVNEMPESQLKYEIGSFGGTLRSITNSIGWDADVFVACNEPLLNTPGILGDEITGNVLKDFETSSDQKEFTFYLREGLKWSDGTPVTMEDFKFTVEDVIFNEELTPVFPSWLNSGGKVDGSPFTFEVVDDWTFKIKFDQAYAGFPVRMAIQGWRGYTDLLKPAHYLKQFHKKYADADELEKAIEEAGFQKGEWVNLFNDKDITNWELTNPKAVGFPALYPWILTRTTETTEEFERNPYYFKVDAEGNQLPYIDMVRSDYISDLETANMKIISGEVDFNRCLVTMNKIPVYKENEKNGYKVYFGYSETSQSDILLNMTYEDAAWRKVVQDARFRTALDLALNRDEILEAIYYGFADKTLHSDNVYDVEQANKLLDEMGMKKGSDGYRLDPDGNKFTIPLEFAGQIPSQEALAELVAEMWGDIGVHVTVKKIDEGLWGTRNSANELQCTIIWTFSLLYWGCDMGRNYWCPLWARWWDTAGKEGEEPPADAKKMLELIEKTSTGTPEEGADALKQIQDEMKKNHWYFIPFGLIESPIIANEKLGNVADKAYAIATNFSAETFFFRQ